MPQLPCPASDPLPVREAIRGQELPALPREVLSFDQLALPADSELAGQERFSSSMCLLSSPSAGGLRSFSTFHLPFSSICSSLMKPWLDDVTREKIGLYRSPEEVSLQRCWHLGSVTCSSPSGSLLSANSWTCPCCPSGSEGMRISSTTSTLLIPHIASTGQ